MNPKFKPMLATQVSDLSKIQYPVLASAKLDGIRCCIFNGVALSRSLKPIPNTSIQSWAKDNSVQLEGLDGEFIVGNPTDPNVFRNTTSFVMSKDKEEHFNFFVFDKVIEGMPSDKRQEVLQQIKGVDKLHVLKQTKVSSKVDLETFQEVITRQGYEGVMIKSLGGLYKYGRSSLKEGLLLKMKLFKTEEFEITGYECKYHNSNEATKNELGRTARSSHKDGMIALETLGVLNLRTNSGLEFGCGTGFDDKTRDELWKTKDSLIGQYCSVKYFDVGSYSVPRFPVFRGIRSKLDM